MMPHVPVLLALLAAGCATARGGGVAGPTVGLPANSSADVALPSDPGTTGPGALRPKQSASGAKFAEEWSAALAAAIARHAADPTDEREIELAHAYREAGILDQAYDRYEAVTRRDPRQADAWDGLARIWRDWGFPGLALGDAHRAVWADPQSPGAHNTLGTVLQQLGKASEARREFGIAVALDPSAAYAHFNLGVACAAQLDYDAAAVAFDRAVALDPLLAPARLRAMEARQHQPAAVGGKGGDDERR